MNALHALGREIGELFRAHPVAAPAITGVAALFVAKMHDPASAGQAAAVVAVAGVGMLGYAGANAAAGVLSGGAPAPLHANPSRPAATTDPHDLWRVSVTTTEAASHGAPVVRHTFYGRTATEARGVMAAHKGTDAFFRGCARGRWDGIKCHNERAHTRPPEVHSNPRPTAKTPEEWKAHWDALHAKYVAEQATRVPKGIEIGARVQDPKNGRWGTIVDGFQTAGDYRPIRYVRFDGDTQSVRLVGRQLNALSKTW